MVTELIWHSVRFFEALEHLIVTNPTEDLHFINNSLESLKIYTHSYVTFCFVGGSP
jgi:hypothetical protein